MRTPIRGSVMNVDVIEALLPIDVLFIHGNLSSNAWWKPAFDVWTADLQASGTVQAHGRAIAGEWRGCGASGEPKTEDELHPKNLARDYVELLRELGVRKAHVVGHSTGCLIALYAMAQAPELFERALLLDPVTERGVKFPPEAFEGFLQMSKSRDACQAAMAATIHDVDPKSALFQKFVDDAFSVAPLIWTAIPKILSSFDDGALAAQVRQPCLVLHGELDPVLPLADSRALAGRLKRGEFFELKGCGHSANVEDPELFVRLADEHLFQIEEDDDEA